MSSSLSTGSQAPRSLGLGVVVFLLGISQIVGYGSISYSYAIIAPGFSAEFGVDPTLSFSVLSFALVLSGLANPFLGRLIDRRGAATIMVVGSVAVVAMFGLIALAPNFWLLAALIVLLQNVGLCVLYGASFPTLANYAGDDARKAITQLTLIGGFASTMFWPITGWLMQAIGWRGTMLAFGVLHLMVALPIHLLIARRQPDRKALSASGQVSSGNLAHNRKLVLWMAALCFGITAIVSTALVVHMVPILQMSGLAEHTYLVSMIVGPSMVLVRVGEVLVWKNLSPMVTTALSALCFPVAIVLLMSGMPTLVAGVLFALFYGFGHGLSVIALGTLPLYLFGRTGYGEVLGRLNASRALLSAGAPAAFRWPWFGSASAPP